MQEKMKEYGQDRFFAAENTTGIGPQERAAIRQLNELSVNGLEKLMKEQQLDAIVTPDAGAIGVISIGGLPGIAMPAGYDEDGAPFGISFGGIKGYEPRLIEIAYAFEHATEVRRPPTFKP